MLGAAIAWAAAPPARGGHAISVIPSTQGALVSPVTTGGGDSPVPVVAVTPEAGPTVTVDARATPSFTVVQTGDTATLDAGASPCNNGGCDFSWRAYGPATNRLGLTVGFGPQVSFTPPSAGDWTIVVTETEYCVPGGGTSLRSCPGVAQQTITVG
jgi:hypothetical protein